MRISGVDFPEPLLSSLREGRLVVFAGAGVSMGQPACLPSFGDLACRIAEGTGKSREKDESEDRFLGRLKDPPMDVDVHGRAAQLLAKGDPKPTELHRNLLHLCPPDGHSRIVTTNFDPLFEIAAEELCLARPEVFRAPALPLGQRFKGIVHLHGSVVDPNEMVLTDKDFGRAYLTENDGWARRFLVELFSSYTVLFVGYSHNETVMTYLARALLPFAGNSRYVLAGSLDPRRQAWNALGIEPIEFHQSRKNDYSELDQAVSSLAKHIRRGLLDWRSVIIGIARQPPPIDTEAADIIEMAFRKPETTRFFTKEATSPEWLEWLDNRNYLDGLFGSSSLEEREEQLAMWLASNFTHIHSNALFSVIGRHDNQLGPFFWRWLGLAVCGQESSVDTNLSRWLSLLINTVPAKPDTHVLREMAQECAQQDLMVQLVQIYEILITYLCPVQFIFDESNILGETTRLRYPPAGNESCLHTLWHECLASNLASVAESLLEKSTSHLARQHSTLCAWQQANSVYEPSSQWPMLICQYGLGNPYSYPNDEMLIIIARDCLERLIGNEGDTSASWAVKHARSDVPLLRRLAIHSLSVRSDLTSNAKIKWLLKHADLLDHMARNELIQVAGQAYHQVSGTQREFFISALLASQCPRTENLEAETDQELHLDRDRFAWLSVLASSTFHCCPIAKQHRDQMLERYPAFATPDHPDEMKHPKVHSDEHNPITVEKLLTQPAARNLPELLTHQGEKYLISPRHEVVTAVAAAAQQNSDWGVDMSRALAKTEQWSSDLWTSLIHAWSKVEMDQPSLAKVLKCLAAKELYPQYAGEIAELLWNLIRKPDFSAVPDSLLSQSDTIAASLWSHIDPTDSLDISADTRFIGNFNPGSQAQLDAWLYLANHRPAGQLALYWIFSIELWRNRQTSAPQELPEQCQDALTIIMREANEAGKLGRSVLVGQIHYLLEVDREWTKGNLLPLLDTEHEDFQAAWNGFLAWGHNTPSLAELLREKFIKAITCIDRELAGAQRQDQFVRHYTLMLDRFATGPTDEWITTLIQRGDDKVRHFFACEVERILKSKDESQRQESWERWIRGYWENRLQGVPVLLSGLEIEIMLDWTILLSTIFQEAVNLAVRMPVYPLEQWPEIPGLKDSDLLHRYPDAVATLLIHIGKSIPMYRSRRKTKEVIDQLLQYNLQANNKTGLEELSVRIDL